MTTIMTHAFNPYYGNAAWAKFDSKTGNTHPLTHHSLDVAHVFASLAKTPAFSRTLAEAAGKPLGDGEHMALTALAFMHDIGKISPGFQRRSRSAPEAARHSRTNHLEAAFEWHEYAFEDHQNALDGNFIPLITAFTGTIEDEKDEDNWREWFRLGQGHHGSPFPSRNPRTAFRQDLSGYDWKSEERRLGQVLAQICPDLGAIASNPVPNRPALQHAFLGLLTLADWIGSDVDRFASSMSSTMDYQNTSRAIAEFAVKELGFIRTRSMRGPSSFNLVLPGAQPSPLQHAVGDVDPNARIVLVEDETGGGKTEAALFRFARLWEAGKVDSLFFAVPTRSAAKQLHERIVSSTKAIFDPAPSVVLAMPGQIVAGEARGYRAPGFNVVWDESAADAGAKWAAEKSAKFAAAEIAVGTIDQAMTAALRVKHAHLRAAALSRALLVIDEVHASDIYMRGIQRQLIDNHIAIGGFVLLMSATLGSDARAAFLKTPADDHDVAADRPYPAVWTEKSVIPYSPTSSVATKDVEMERIADWTPAGVAARAIVEARNGGVVLVIRNTVDVARDTFLAIERDAPGLLMEIGGRPAMHHSRYAAEDRALLDATVEKILGRRPDRGHGQGKIIVGTQTLEQSLDIDADILLTDIVPIDVLLQRIGRLHRWARRSDAPVRAPGFEKPRAVVMCPASGYDSLLTQAQNGVGSYDRNGAISGVYVNLPAVVATDKLLEQKKLWSLPTMNRSLVEDATHPDKLTELCRQRDGGRDGSWSTYLDRLTATDIADSVLASRYVLDLARPYPEKYPDDEVIRTRLGEIGAILDFPPGTIGPFGREITKIGVPALWSRGLGDETVSVTPDGEKLTIHCSDGRTFTYGHAGLTR